MPTYPIIWRKSKHHVATEYVQAQVDIHLRSPCDSINSTWISPMKKSHPIEDEEQQIKCEEKYQRLVIQTFQKHCSPLLDKKRIISKRNIITFAAGIVITVIVMVATIGFAAYIKNQSGVYDQTLSENELKKLDHEIHRKMVDQLIHMQQEIDRLQHISLNREISTIFYSKFLQIETLINEIFITSLDKPISKLIFQLFENFTICPNCPSDNWFLEECQIRPHRSPYESILRLNINAVKIDKQYDIIRADPFYLLVEDKLNKSNLCFSMYSGTRYAIMNKITKCARNIMFDPIDDHQSPFIFHSVDCKNNTNFSKAKWKTIECRSKELITPEEIVQVKNDENFIYFYCFNQNITIQGLTYPCKNQIYKIKRGQSLTINQQTVSFTKMKIDLHHHIHDDLSEILNVQTFDTFGSSINLQDLSTMVEKEDQLINKIIYSYLQTYYIHLIVIISIILLLIFITLFYCQYNKTKNYKKIILEQYRLAALQSSHT
ncbi:hypothetical protein DERF_006554 [Dermatophagoides farinae]|uniref:Uncharacterized protein n=1 Tax=Dermatophagoides farinae TaxID=6954 RepID=A0A922L788_DERFA|nr:hypothetical protein DERF_006554 [Dermatophagoides farinae]